MDNIVWFKKKKEDFFDINFAELNDRKKRIWSFITRAQKNPMTPNWGENVEEKRPFKYVILFGLLITLIEHMLSVCTKKRELLLYMKNPRQYMCHMLGHNNEQNWKKVLIIYIYIYIILFKVTVTFEPITSILSKKKKNNVHFMIIALTIRSRYQLVISVSEIWILGPLLDNKKT